MLITNQIQKDGFDIAFYALPDEMTAAEVCGEEQLADDIEQGRWQLFCAKVTASKCGVELGSDYLGQCIYEDYEDFIECDYFKDMVDSAINEAKSKIEELTR